MKILVFGRNWTDYLQDDVYHGLKSLYGQDVESNVNLEYLYEDYAGDTTTLYGMGFSYARTLDPRVRNVVYIEEISQKLADNYYDVVVYLSHHRCAQQFDEVVKRVPWGRILLCDGEDDPLIARNVLGYKVFKRELEGPDGFFGPHVFPISFAIPKSKIFEGLYGKDRDYAESIPRLVPESPERRAGRPNYGMWKFDNSHYQFKTEEAYYNDYRRSRYAYTCRKGGWDCKRHYEIIMNKCVPVFIDIGSCPDKTITTLPKKLLVEVERSHKGATICQYESWLSDFSSVCEELTTINLAEYLLSKVD